MTRRRIDAQSAIDAAVVEYETRAYTVGDETAVIARDVHPDWLEAPRTPPLTAAPTDPPSVRAFLGSTP